MCGTRVGEDLAWDALGCDAVFIASGAHRGREAGIDGEQGPGIQPGLAFLKRVNAKQAGLTLKYLGGPEVTPFRKQASLLKRGLVDLIFCRSHR